MKNIKNKVWISTLILSSALTAHGNGGSVSPNNLKASTPEGQQKSIENDIRSKPGIFKPESLRTAENVFKETKELLESIVGDVEGIKRELVDLKSSLANKKITPEEQSERRKNLITSLGKISDTLNGASEKLIQNRRPVEFQALEDLKRDIAASKGEEEYTKTQQMKYRQREADIDAILKNIAEEYLAFEADINKHKQNLKKWEASMERWLPLIFNGLTIKGLNALINDLDALNQELKKMIKGNVA